MYAGISGYRGASGTAYLFVSTNNGSNWTNVTTHLPSGCDFCRVTADPTQKGVAHLAVLSGSEHVLKTTDYGSSWTALSSTSNGFDDNPPQIMCVDSLNGYILAGTYWGLYLSTDDGSTWSKFSSGLPNAVVDDIAIQYSHGRAADWQPRQRCVGVLPSGLLAFRAGGFVHDSPVEPGDRIKVVDAVGGAKRRVIDY